jgi:hypothetical protein
VFISPLAINLPIPIRSLLDQSQSSHIEYQLPMTSYNIRNHTDVTPVPSGTKVTEMHSGVLSHKPKVDIVMEICRLSLYPLDVALSEIDPGVQHC